MYHYSSVLLVINLLITNTLLDSEPFDKIGRNAQKSIVDEPSCQEVGVICHNLSDNDDLLILECLLNSNPRQINALSAQCHNIIWGRVRNITDYKGVQRYLKPVCGNDLSHFKCPIETYLKCIANDADISEKVNPMCFRTINRLENVAFTDYRWISDFLKQCEEDITQLECGVIDSDNFSQLKTVSCLQNKISSVKEACRKEVFHLSELQSNSIKWDSQLSLDCREDYQRYCSELVEGSGRVFPCLMRYRHSDESKIGTKCRQHLKRREKLIAQDFKVSKGLLKACKEDIRKTSCKQRLSSDKTVKLAQILLCLENFMRHGKNPAIQVSPDCQSEIVEHRKLLMDDYSLSPEVVSNCKNETALFCAEYGYGGKTLHCLLGHASYTAEKKMLGASCLRALEDLIHETDPGENWNVDPVLRQACDPVVKVACRNVKGGNGRVISCLMDNLRSDIMTEECLSALLEIQYFIARDFELDPQLYKACSEDAVKHCHFDAEVDISTGPSYSSQVLPCLYRLSSATEEGARVTKSCRQQIKRVMRQRAKSVDLQPEIEEACLPDLGFHCLDKSKKGEEIQCLQDNLDNLGEKCQKAVEDFTELEAENVELNPYISKYCNKVIDDLCENDDDVIECLIENKNHPRVKSVPNCRASIEHFQIISLKDYKFTSRFKQACKSYAMRLCGGATKKSSIVECLSEHILNATVHGVKSVIHKDCRQQLKAQIFQQREKIDYSPDLKRACVLDIEKFCKSVPVGNAQILECLQMVPRNDLSPLCGKEIFKIQKSEVYDNSLDYALQTNCAEMIDQYCPHHDKETVFGCLKMNKDEKGFSRKCREIVAHRLVEQNSNFLLNPSLQKNCQLDMNKFCKRELAAPQDNSKKSEDSIVKCLRNQFKLSKLSHRCEQEMADILRERALDISLDPLTRYMCKLELESICKSDDDTSGYAVECLKSAFLAKRLSTRQCEEEVAGLIEGSEPDIQADPVLQKACALDLITHCKDVEQGGGRKIECLKSVRNFGKELSPDCEKKLKERLQMYNVAAQVYDLKSLYWTVSRSPSKNYFAIVVLMIVGAVFFVGVFYGRCTKRKYRLLKNK